MGHGVSLGISGGLGVMTVAVETRAISWTAETVENFLPPFSVSKTQVNKQLLLVTTSSQVRKPQTMANIGNMIVRTHIITEEY